MSLGLVPTQISCHFFSLGVFYDRFFSGRRSNHDVLLVVAKLQVCLLIAAISVKATVLYTCFFIIVHWCSAETCKINLIVRCIGCLLCSVAEICSLGLVHYADNSHHSCRGPTFEKNLFVQRLFQQRWQRRFLEIRLKRHNFACV